MYDRLLLLEEEEGKEQTPAVGVKTIGEGGCGAPAGALWTAIIYENIMCLLWWEK